MIKLIIDERKTDSPFNPIQYRYHFEGDQFKCAMFIPYNREYLYFTRGEENLSLVFSKSCNWNILIWNYDDNTDMIRYTDLSFVDCNRIIETEFNRFIVEGFTFFGVESDPDTRKAWMVRPNPYRKVSKD